MLHKTEGIVLSSIKYAETSIVCRIYTAQFGLQSYLINGVRKKKGKSNYYQPLSLLELVVYHKENGGLQRIKEVKPAYSYQEIPFKVLKSSVALFLAEILGKSLREEEENPALFHFLKSAFIQLDEQPFDGLFHFRFLLDLSTHLGFQPNTYNNDLPFFDLMNGQFVAYKPTHPHFVEAPLISTFAGLVRKEAIKISNKTPLLKCLLEYYELHLDGFTKVRSLEVLETVLKT